jgi:hypothetical protein
MRAVMLLGSLLLATVTTARAQEAPDMFKDVPKSHWAYDALQSLQTDGFLVLYPSHGQKERSLSPYEFAIMVDRLLKTIQKQSREGMRITESQATTLSRLSHEFKDTLVALGRPTWTKANVNAVLLGALDASKARLVPREHWTYGAMENLHAVGLTPDDPGGYFDGKESRGRLEFAARLVTAFKKMPRMGSTGLLMETNTLGRVTYSPTAAADIRRLAREFMPELIDFGYTPGGVQRLSNELALLYVDQAHRAEPFQDIPSRHWSYRAVERLRLRGVMRGYPDGSFRGGAHKVAQTTTPPAVSGKMPDWFVDVDRGKDAWLYDLANPLGDQGVLWAFRTYKVSKRTSTRYEFTVSLHDALVRIKGPLTELHKERGYDRLLSLTPQQAASFRRLCHEFRPELDYLISLHKVHWDIDKRIDIAVERRRREQRP